MRWENLRRSGPSPDALFGTADVVTRTVTTPEFRGVTFYEVLARSVLNRVPAAARVPFEWTINPYRGCGHGCVYCFARNTHTYLDLDTGRDFDTKIVVKINAVERLRAELADPRWQRHPVAMGTNTDPYQRAEGRYRLMPGIIRALVASGTPFSVLTKGTLLARDLPELTAASADVDVRLAVSIAHLDPAVHRLLEPGTPSPQARLDLVRRIREAGLACEVLVAPVLPWLTDSPEQLDRLLGQIAAAGATGATVLALHLRPGAREWFLRHLREHYPDLVAGYQRLYGGGSYVDREYQRRLTGRVRPLLRAHRLDSRRNQPSPRPATAERSARAAPPDGALRSAGRSRTADPAVMPRAPGAPGAGWGCARGKRGMSRLALAPTLAPCSCPLSLAPCPLSRPDPRSEYP